MKEMIFKRKSTRAFLEQEVDATTLQKINAFIEGIVPLYKERKIRFSMVTREEVKCICPWTTQKLIAVYGDAGEGAWENAGFMMGILDLYLHSIGIGTCYLGMGRMKENLPQKDGCSFMMLLAFGYPKGELYRKEQKEFKRKSILEISDIPDERLEVARLAPSGVNAQPWYFTHEGEKIHVFCKKGGLLKHQFLSDMERMDVGIALSHLYVCHEETFRFFKEEGKEKKGYGYMGTVTL